MRWLNRITPPVVTAFGVMLVGIIVLAIGAARSIAVEPVADVSRVLKADDFWSQTGAKLTHDDIPFDQRNTIRELAGNSNETMIRIRAYKLLADSYQRTRYSEQFSQTQTLLAIEGVFRYLENNINEETISKFRPELGFTHITTSKRNGDPGSIWVLIESSDGVLPSGGLNIRWSPTDKTVNRVEHWGANRDPVRQPGVL